MRDKYRPHFCSPAFYLDHQTIFDAWSCLFRSLNKHNQTQYWTLGLSLLRRPRDWFGGFRKEKFLAPTDASALSVDLKLKDLLNKTPVQLPKALPGDISILELLATVRVKPLPEIALQSLYELPYRKKEILILNTEPTPFELLHLQSQGKRVITFDSNFETWPTLLYGKRDVLSFVLHDLIHAHHFFSDLESQKRQVGFYRNILKIKNDPDFKKLYSSDSNFAEQFNYIISDMNAHPVHLFQTLKASVNKIDSGLVWSRWAMVWGCSKAEQTAIENINTPLFSDLNGYSIESICSRESYKLGLL